MYLKGKIDIKLKLIKKSETDFQSLSVQNEKYSNSVCCPECLCDRGWISNYLVVPIKIRINVGRNVEIVLCVIDQVVSLLSKLKNNCHM